jgi:hypothetical protein
MLPILCFDMVGISDFKSEGASQYGAKPGQHKRESFAPRGASIVSGLPFDGTSTSKTDFPQWHGARPPAPYKLGDSVLRPAGENRDFKSEAAGHFTDKSHPYVFTVVVHP